MRRRKVPHRLTAYATAWAVVGGSFLWSINALADGIERPMRAAAIEEPPDYADLLGGEDVEEPVEVAIVKPKPEEEERNCITFEDAIVLIGKIENQRVADVDAFIRDLQLDLGDEEWCGGVRETIKIAFIDDPEEPGEEPDPEEPDEPDHPRDPTIPGGGGGPGYAASRGI